MDIEIFKKELNRCLGCKVMPCAKGCPLGLSPHDFIALAKAENYTEAATAIASKNPLPQTCGLVCPDLFCQSACIRKRIDGAIEIPCLQAEIIKKAGLPTLSLPAKNGKKVAIIGGGPAGLGALFKLITNGWCVDIYEKAPQLGGVARLIPEYRLPKTVLDNEISRLIDNDRVNVYLNTEITNFRDLQKQYDGVILAMGEPTPYTLGVKGEDYCVSYKDFLTNIRLPSESKVTQELARREKFCEMTSDVPQERGAYIEVRDPNDVGLPSESKVTKFLRIAICGGGEVALDCALTAVQLGAKVDMFVRRRREDMRIMARDQKELDEKGVTVHALTSITEINSNNEKLCLTTISNKLNEEGKAVHCAGTECDLDGYDMVVQALGSHFPKENIPEGFIIAGDMSGTTGTIVQALASGISSAQKLLDGEV